MDRYGGSDYLDMLEVRTLCLDAISEIERYKNVIIRVVTAIH